MRWSGASAPLFVALVSLLVSLPPCLADAQPRAGDVLTGTPVAAPRVGRAKMVQVPPVIDGKLTDEVWKDAPRLDGFVQREPKEHQPVSERTEVRLLTDGEALYVGVWAYDRDAGGIVPGEKVRDVTLTNSDYVAILLDTYHDKQNGFLFATTPVGVEYDGQIIREGEGGGVVQTGQTSAQAGSMGGFNLNWDGSWKVMTSIDSTGWFAEFRIPFSTLRFGGDARQTWGLNFVRMIRRKNEESFWSFVPRQFNLYRMSLAGALDELDVPVKRVATVTPYVLASGTRTFDVDAKNRYPAEWGVDAKYGVTPSLTLDLTYNTDFAQVEVDEQRTNLTRFPLFFPEKRPFFLENAGVFSAGTPQAVDLFFSRRIGIDDNGSPVPILGGGRLTGRVGGTTVGAMQLFTDKSEGGTVQGQSYTVLRALREVSRRSRVGLIGIERLAQGNAKDYNRTLGADARVGVGDRWTLDGWGALTTTPEKHGNDRAFSARAAYLTGNWNNSARYLETGRDFNPEVGFLSRPAGFRYLEVIAMRLVRRPQWTRVRQWNPHMSYRGYFGIEDGYWQSGQIHYDMTEVELSSGGRFGPEANTYHEGLQKPFVIAPGDTLPVGRYTWTSYGLDWSTNPASKLSMLLRGDFGPFYNGTRNGGTVTVVGREGASLSTSLVLDYQNVVLDQGRFTRTVTGIKAAWLFTPRVFLQTLTQYNNQQKIWTANARFGWLNTGGTGLFVVLNDGEVADGFFSWQRPVQRSVVVKFTRQLGTRG